MSKSKKVTYITPRGEFVWPKLDEPDTYQAKDKKGNPKGDPKTEFKLNIRFDEKTEAKVRRDLEELTKQFGSEVGDNEHSPWKEDKQDKKPQGTFTLFASSAMKDKKTGELIRPPAFDSKNRKLPEGVVIGGGTIGRVDVILFPYDTFGGGVKLYINGVQVIKLVERSFGKSNFDEVEDGYEIDEEDDAPVKGNFGSPTEHADLDEDDEVF
jgi:hypothetical protein